MIRERDKAEANPSAPETRHESGAEKPRDTILVATWDGKPDTKIEDVLKDWQPGLNIRWISSNDIPDIPPADVKVLVLNAGDRPSKETYDSHDVLVNRLAWHRDGSWAGWSAN